MTTASPCCGKTFQLRPLALEDVTEFGQRPKVETYGNVAYLVSYGVREVGEDPAEVHCFVAERFLVTVRTEHCLALDHVREYVEQPGGQLPGDREPTQLVFLHHVVDSLVDSYFPTLADFDDRIDDLQDQIFARPNEDDMPELFALQRSLVGSRKLVSPQRDVMASLVRAWSSCRARPRSASRTSAISTTTSSGSATWSTATVTCSATPWTPTCRWCPTTSTR